MFTLSLLFLPCFILRRLDCFIVTSPPLTTSLETDFSLFDMLLTSTSRGKLALAAAVFCIVTIVISYRSTLFDPGSWRQSFHEGVSQIPTKSPIIPGTNATAPSLDECDGFPDTSDILVVMKTGATEAYDKVPIHFMTDLKCVKDYVLFSDMEMDIANHKLIDTLDEIPEDRQKDNRDFELYKLLKEYRQVHEDPRALKEGANGWNLDKYKFLPMMLKTWKRRPDAKWYVFVEADTYTNWDNMRTFLDMLNPEKPYYIGSPTYLDIEFAHGGTGYIISNAAMRKGVGEQPDISEKYDPGLPNICCGDRQIAKVLFDQRIKLTKAWPMLNGEKPHTLPYSKPQWCQPVLTMHHMTALEVSQVWNFEQKRKTEGIKASTATNVRYTPSNRTPQTPMLWKDVFNYFVKDSLLPLREDWSNLSEDLYTPDETKDFHGQKWHELSDLQRASPESSDNCKKLCESDPDCFQWEHQNNECRTSNSFKMGGSKKPVDGKRVTSGWRFEKIGEFRKEMDECAGGPDWNYQEPDGWFGMRV